jgi:hypothetical protein
MLDPLTTNDMAQYKNSFNIIMADAPKIKPATSPITPTEQMALTSLKDIAQLHSHRPIHVIMDRLSTLLLVYMQ